ncbi:hypothetical protein GOBAR_AA38441 [Gossypium barbadense]|uniref:Uncharacterized protein n=1 Tax=Gossypium barbadense TaxID=3634 RepID=A0A2P5VTV8_GOSBA|nr:hypothetical protein GOBAR_AA38441 [Gossypium barbadense]
MALGVEIAEMGWHLSLRAQSRRALAMNSIWLREEDMGELGGNREGSQVPRNSLWDIVKKRGIARLLIHYWDLIWKGDRFFHVNGGRIH